MRLHWRRRFMGTSAEKVFVHGEPLQDIWIITAFVLAGRKRDLKHATVGGHGSGKDEIEIGPYARSDSRTQCAS